MSEKNKSIYNFLSQYVNMSNPQYAVLLTGDWGSGKTYFVKNWI